MYPRGSGNATPFESTYDTDWLAGVVGVTTATGALPPPPEPPEDPVDPEPVEPEPAAPDPLDELDPEVPGAFEDPLVAVRTAAPLALALGAADAAAETARGPALAADAVAGCVETSTVAPELVPGPDPLPPSVSTGALNRSAHVRVSIFPLEPRLWRDWKSSTAARVSGP